jgi:cobalt-zinc-cadmium efflux system outer membrane protein
MRERRSWGGRVLLVVLAVAGLADPPPARAQAPAPPMAAPGSMRMGEGGGMPMPLPAGDRPVPMPGGGRPMSLPTPPEPRPSSPTAPVTAAPLMTLADLEAIALRSNPTLVQAQAQVDASLSKSFQAGLPPNPVAGYVSEQMGTGTASLGETQGWFVEQEIMRGGKLRLSRAKYRQEAAQARLQVQAQQLRVLNGVRDRYYEVLAARRLLAVVQELLGNYEEMVRTTGELVNLGQANRPDLLQARVGAQRQRVRLRAAENRLSRSWVDLTTALGCPDLPPAPLPDNLETDGPPLDWDESLRQILQFSPEIQVARAEVLRDEITVQRERVQPVPNMFARVENGYNFEVNLVTTGVQVGWNLPVWNRNQGTVREAMAEVTRARAEVARLELHLRRRLAEAFAHYQTALATVRTYRAEALPQAREASDLTLEGYRQRRAPWAQVVLAHRTLSDLNEDYIEALLELRRSEVAIRGMLLVDGLSRPEPPTPGGHIDATPQPR